MQTIKLARNFGKKIVMVVIFGLLMLVTMIILIRDVFLVGTVNGFSLFDAVKVTVIAVVFLAAYSFLSLLMLSTVFTQLTEEGIWQLQSFHPVFIRWIDIQKVEVRLGIRLLIAPQGVIQIHL